MGKDVIVACDFASAEATFNFLDKFENEERKPPAPEPPLQRVQPTKPAEQPKPVEEPIPVKEEAVEQPVEGIYTSEEDHIIIKGVVEREARPVAPAPAEVAPAVEERTVGDKDADEVDIDLISA